MVSVSEKCNLKEESNDGDNIRKDPTFFLPDEPMSYEIKSKKKKKRKKKVEDPFGDIDNHGITKDTPAEEVAMMAMKLEPEVSIKVENIEVELDFNDFASSSGLMVEGPQTEDSQEPIVKLEEENKEAVLLTFESIINNTDEQMYECEQKPQKGMRVCKICHLVFQSQRTLKMHQRRKHKIYRRSFKHICDHCGMSYEMKNSLVAHIRRKHGPGSSPSDTAERACEICALVFKGTPRLRMHMRRKHGAFEDSFKHACEYCGLTYDKYRSLLVHVNRKHTRIENPVSDQWFNCPFCPKAFSRRETYSRHMQRTHKVTEDESNKTDSLPNGLVESKNEETGEVACKECPLVFSSVSYLKLHMRRKHNALKEDFRLKCRICNLSYNKIESLKRHVLRKHDKGSYCSICNKQFDTREMYLNHSHAKVIKECSICGLIFASQGGLAKHMRCTHKIDSPKVVFCGICNEGFHDKRLLKPHLLKVHLNATYTCKFCNKVFKAKESFRRHVLVQHPTQSKVVPTPQQCEQCSETFSDEFELCRHIDIAHTNQDTVIKPKLEVKSEETDIKDTYQCTKCPDIFITWEELKAHHESTHYISPKTQCQICGQLIKGDLQKHIRLKHTAPVEKCKYCEFVTGNKTSMTQHMLRHKNATSFNCDSAGCKYKSYYEGAMEKHKQKHAEIGVKLQCSKCPFQTMNKYILRYHEEAHVTGKKRYACDQCDYATILPANLVQHKYKHSTEKRFKCEVCPFATKYNTSLRFHVKKKHCDLPSLN